MSEIAARPSKQRPCSRQKLLDRDCAFCLQDPSLGELAVVPLELTRFRGNLIAADIVRAKGSLRAVPRTRPLRSGRGPSASGGVVEDLQIVERRQRGIVAVLNRPTGLLVECSHSAVAKTLSTSAISKSATLPAPFAQAARSRWPVMELGVMRTCGLRLPFDPDDRSPRNMGTSSSFPNVAVPRTSTLHPDWV